jgi:membrane associated rhomboid family serine protease
MIVGGVAVVLRKGVPKAYGLGLVMMAVFLLDIVARIGHWGLVQEELGFRTSRLLSGGGWWTPLTYAFIHQAPSNPRGFFSLHLVGNLFILLTAGPALEERVGERRFLVIFGAGALATLVAHVALGFVLPSIVGLGSLALGASGAIFAVLTAFAVRYPKEKLPILLVFFLFWLPSFVVLLIYLGFNVAYMAGDYASGTSGGIGWWGHFAGFLLGLGLAARLPEVPVGAGAAIPKGAKGLPDPEKLAPLATSPDLKRILDRIRQFTPDARTQHDSTFTDAWLEKFFEKATCDRGHAFVRDGMTATCAGGETTVEFAR